MGQWGGYECTSQIFYIDKKINVTHSILKTIAQALIENEKVYKAYIWKCYASCYAPFESSINGLSRDMKFIHIYAEVHPVRAV